MKISRRAVIFSLMLSFAAVTLTSISVGGGNLEYDVIICSASASGTVFCSYVHGHGVPWVWLELESVTEQHSGEAVSLSIKQLLPLNLAGDFAFWFLPLLIFLSLRSYSSARSEQTSSAPEDK